MSYETETAGPLPKPRRATTVNGYDLPDQETGKAVARVAEEYDLMAQVFDGIDQAGLAAIRARNSN